MLVLTGSRFRQPGATKDWDIGEVITILEQVPHSPTLLLCRTGQDEHAARTVRGILKRSDLGILALNEPETRFRALAYCLLQLRSRAYGQAQMVVRALSPALHTRVVLSSVSKLTSPTPTMKQHLQSITPGSLFTFDLGPEQSPVSKVKSAVWNTPGEPSNLGRRRRAKPHLRQPGILGNPPRAPTLNVSHMAGQVLGRDDHARHRPQASRFSSTHPFYPDVLPILRQIGFTPGLSIMRHVA